MIKPFSQVLDYPTFTDSEGRRIIIADPDEYATQPGQFGNGSPTLIWFFQISPMFVLVHVPYGGLDDALEIAYDCICHALNDGDDVCTVDIHESIQELLEEGKSEEEAYDEATEDCYAINGGAVYISNDDWGAQEVSKEGLEEASRLCKVWEEGLSVQVYETYFTQESVAEGDSDHAENAGEAVFESLQALVDELKRHNCQPSSYTSWHESLWYYCDATPEPGNMDYGKWHAVERTYHLHGSIPADWQERIFHAIH